MIVVSTAFNPPPEAKAKCLDSVDAQKGVRAHHRYVDCTGVKDPPSITENLRNALFDLDPRCPVAWLDGDDWLAHDGVLAHIARVYQDPDVWLTYGSFQYADGRPGFCQQYRTSDYRREPWKASHLKTFRAGLFQRINPADLDFTLAVDQAVMLPMLELSGPERQRFVPQVLYTYNYASSYEHRATPAQLEAEQAAVKAIRAREPYARLEAL